MFISFINRIDFFISTKGQNNYFYINNILFTWNDSLLGVYSSWISFYLSYKRKTPSLTMKKGKWDY